MPVRSKMTIENKIAIPFLTLFVVSLSVVLLTSFKFDHDYVMQSQFRQMDKQIEEIEVSINLDLHKYSDEQSFEEGVTERLRYIYPNELLIYKGDVLIMGDSHRMPQAMTFHAEVGTAHLSTEQLLIAHKYVATTGWMLVVVADKSELMSYFYESYKYNILIGIIFLTLALQITIWVSANITKPIRILSKFCDGIAGGDYNRKIELDRADEFGKLSDALNQMVEEVDRSMQELIYVKNYNQDILNNIENGIITYDLKLAEISKNPFAEAIIKARQSYRFEAYTLEALLKAHILEPQSVDENGFGLIKLVSETGDLCYIDFNISQIRAGETVSGYICSFRDVTEQKKVEGQIQRLERLASTGRLAAGVAHEIRNPLAGMKAGLQVLNKRFKRELSGNNEKLFLSLLHEIDRINKLTVDLLDYAKRMKSKPERLIVEDKLSEILMLVSGEVKRKCVKLRVEIKTKNLTVFADSAQFSQIMLNILKNSIEAVEFERGVIQIDINSSEYGVIIAIRDNGEGIDEASLDKIFDPFYTTKPEGTGLGLSIVHELVAENEGRIEMISKIGEGTTVQIQFRTGGEL